MCVCVWGGGIMGFRWLRTTAPAESAGMIEAGGGGAQRSHWARLAWPGQLINAH